MVKNAVKNIGTVTKGDMSHAADVARFKLIDKLHPIHTLGDIPYKLHSLLGNVHATIGTFLQHGKLSWQDQALTVKTKKEGFLPWLHALKDDGRKLFYWIAVKRAEVLEGEGRENWLTKPKRDAILNEIFEGTDRKAKEAEFEKLNEQFQEWNRNVIDIAVEGGLISKEQTEEWTRDFYLPFYRIFEDEMTREAFQPEAHLGPNQKAERRGRKTGRPAGKHPQELDASYPGIATERSPKGSIRGGSFVGGWPDCSKKRTAENHRGSEQDAIRGHAGRRQACHPGL
jgi:hypothetical protein